MASAWGASFGSAWGASFDLASAAQPSGGGGWYGHYRSEEDRRKYVHAQRVALGMFPAPVKRAIRAAVKRAAENPAPIKPVLLEELETRNIEYRPDYLDALNRLYSIAAKIQAQEEHKTRKRHRSEEEIILMMLH